MSRHAIVRSTTAVLAIAAIAVAASSTAPALSAPRAAHVKLPSRAYRAHDFAHGQAMSILPAGENGSATTGDILTFLENGSHPAHSQDQLGKYNNLLYGYKNVTDAKLGKFYDDESFGVPKKDIIRTEMPSSSAFPKGSVVIERDPRDVPHIYGSTDEAGAFGAGFAQAQDRLFLMDVLRHLGAGNLTSFLPLSCADEEMDHSQLLLAPYTQAQGDAEVTNLPKEYGAQGELAMKMIDAYVAGINTWITKAKANPTTLLDADYQGTINPVPQLWTPADVVSVAGLIGGMFGRGGGKEIASSALYTYLRSRLGAKAGAKAFSEFKEQNDPSAPTTVVGKKFPYETTPKHINSKLTAIPDNPRKPLVGGPTDTTSNCDGTSKAKAGIGAGANPQALADIVAAENTPADMSNALVVDAKDTKAHHPIAVFGPQVAYYSPQILSQEEISTPDYHAEGASFPGTGLVELGRGEDYAWSATSAGSDLIDQRLERICAPGGGAPSARGTSYLFNGKCLAMKKESFNETTNTTAGGGPSTASTVHHTIYLTRHGVVQGWTTALGGKPVAVVNQRSTFNHDVDSVVGFMRWGEPKLTHSVKSWERSAADVSYTFNWFYVDSKHAAYYVSGKDPIRAKGVNPNLPTWGTGDAEWRGFLPASKHIHETDPNQGFFVSWNNKPAPGFSAADDQFGYGPVYRSQMLVGQLKHQMAITHHKLTRADVVKAMETAASQDLDGLKVLPQLLSYTRGHKEPAGVSAMLSTLAAWHAAGSHRVRATPKAKQYQQHAAVAIMDELEPNLIESIYNRLLAKGGLNGKGATAASYSVFPMGFVDTPNGGGSRGGSSFDGGWEGYMMKTLEQLRGKHPSDPFTSIITKKWCSSGPASCRHAINNALLKTFKTLKKENHTAKVAKWTLDSALVSDRATSKSLRHETMPQFDAIAFRVLGLISQPLTTWQNRPTFQQVIQFPAHRRA